MSAALPDSALSACPDPVFILTDRGLLAWSNAAFQRLSASRPLTDVFDSEGLRNICETAHYGCYDVNLKPSNGDQFSQSAVVLDIGSGDPGSSLLLVTLKSTRTEHSRLAAKEEYLATVAHDLRNPLSAIFSYADALIDTSAGDGILPPQRQVMKRIRSTAARCVDLVLNYQMLAQVRARSFLRPAISVDLTDVTRGVVEHTWREDNTSPTVTCDLCSKPLPVFMERVQVERAIANVVTNALKYTPPTGRILVKTFESGTHYAVSVNNTGVELSTGELRTLFDRYTRAKSGERIGGTGLGLFIVKTLMESSSGSVEAKSDPKEGVTVTLNFARTP